MNKRTRTSPQTNSPPTNGEDVLEPLPRSDRRLHLWSECQEENVCTVRHRLAGYRWRCQWTSTTRAPKKPPSASMWPRLLWGWPPLGSCVRPGGGVLFELLWNLPTLNICKYHGNTGKDAKLHPHAPISKLPVWLKEWDCVSAIIKKGQNRAAAHLCYSNS